MDHISIRLPIPISINKAYAGKERRYRSREYLAWIDHANLIMNRYGKFSISGDEWLAVEYTYDMPLYCLDGKKKIQDVGNYEKVLSDFLVKRITGFQDHRIKKITLEKNDSDTNYVTIKIYEINGPPP